jgi:hypothetical protein
VSFDVNRVFTSEIEKVLYLLAKPMGRNAMSKNRAVFGIYSHGADASDAVDRLRSAGFRSTDISMLVSKNEGNKDLALDKSTKAPEGAAAGTGSGIVLGGALGWLAGIGTLAIPGLGPFLAAGPIMALLSGAGVGAAVGGLTGALIGAGIPEYEVKRYEGRIHGGHVLVSVHCDDAEWTSAARGILRETGAEAVSSTSEAAADFDASDRPRPRHASPDHDGDFRRNFEASHGTSGAAYAEFAPCYEYGYRMAQKPEYHDIPFQDAEPELKHAYLAGHPGCDWVKVSSAVLYGWERAGGKVGGFVII